MLTVSILCFFIFSLLLFIFVVGIYSHLEPEKGPDNDVVASGIENVWICEFGSKSLNSSYENFKQNLMGSNVKLNLFEWCTLHTN